MPVQEIRHPLVRHKIGLMRHIHISAKEFRELAQEIAALLTYEITRDLPVEKRCAPGWSGPVTIEHLSEKRISVVPILRAGFGMLYGVLTQIPEATVSAIGMSRDEKTFEVHNYLNKLAPEIAQSTALIIDPMLATGTTLIAAINLLKAAGCKDIRALVLVAAPEGIAALERAHPEVPVLTAAIDRCLNEQGYILPGLGDAGDKVFATQVYPD